MNCIAIIPARSGSKGVPSKPLVRINGKCLLRYAADAGFASRYVQKCILTTDSREYGKRGCAFGLTAHIRPPKLAQDDTPMAPVLLDVLKRFPADIVVCLQPTNPFTRGSDIDACVDLLDGYDSVYSVKRCGDDHPARMIWEDGTPVWNPPKENMRRQELPECFHRDGAVYVVRRESLESGSVYGKRSRYYVTPHTSWNVDEMEDIVIAGALLDANRR